MSDRAPSAAIVCACGHRTFYAVVEGAQRYRLLCVACRRATTLTLDEPDEDTAPAAFHRHLHACAQCDRDPFDLCLIGRRLLRAAVEEPSAP